MKLVQKFTGLFNGGAAAAGPEGLREAITELVKRDEEIKAELAEGVGRHHDLLLTGDNSAIRKFREREVELYLELERIAAQIARLREKLVEQLDAQTQARIEHRVGVLFDLAAKIEVAVMSATALNLECIKAFEAAQAELGEETFPFGRVHFDGMLLPESVEIWRRNLAAIVTAMRRSPTTPRRKPQPAPTNRTTVIGLGDSKRVVPLPLPVAPPASAAPVAPPKTPRRPIRDQARDGHRLITIFFDGYQMPSTGRQAAAGDILALPDEIAREVVRNGMGEFFDGGA